MDFKQTLIDAKVIPVVAVRDVGEALNIADALSSGGVNVLEVTLRTEAGLDAIKAVGKAFPQMLVGCGTVRTTAQVKAAADAGSQFLVSPGTTPALAQAMAATGLPCLPGAGTVTEMLALFQKGFTTQKFFPAEASGGAPFLKAIHGILPEVSFCPTGGVSTDNIQDYLSCPNVMCVGGSWLVPQADIDAENWAAIAARSKNL